MTPFWKEESKGYNKCQNKQNSSFEPRTPLYSNGCMVRLTIHTIILSFLAFQLMVDYGEGFCSEGYYRGWDGQGDANAEECQFVCMREAECRFAAYLDDGASKTCSRYNPATCHLLASSHYQRSHHTFVKKGL